MEYYTFFDMNGSASTWESVTHDSVTDGVGVGQSPPLSALIFMQLLTGLVGIMGNFLVCFVFLHRRTQRNQTNLLITNQAFIDLSASILLVLHVLYDLAGRPEANLLPLRKFSCLFWRGQSILFSCFAVSTFNLTIISLERYCATIFPHSYPNVFTRRNLRFAIAMVWLVSPLMQYILIWTTYTFSEDGRCLTGWSPVWVGILLFFWEYFIPVTVMSFSFASVTRKLRRMNRVLNNDILRVPSSTISSTLFEPKKENAASQPSNVLSLPPLSPRNGPSDSSVSVSCQSVTTDSQRPLSNPSSSSSLPTTSSNIRVTVRRRNATKTLLTVYIVYLICWSPNQWGFFQMNLGGTLDFQGYFYKVSVILVMLNTCVNPFIYALRHKTYKERVRELARDFKKEIPCTQ